MTRSKRDIMGVQGSEANETADAKKYCKSVYRQVLISLHTVLPFVGVYGGKKIFSEADLSLGNNIEYVSFLSAISPTVWSM